MERGINSGNATGVSGTLPGTRTEVVTTVVNSTDANGTVVNSTEVSSNATSSVDDVAIALVWDGGHVVTLLVANAATDTVVVQPSTTITFQITGIQVPAKPLEVVVAVFVAGDAGPVVLSSGNARIGS